MPTAVVFLADGAVFAAEALECSGGLVTATGSFRQRVGLRHERAFRYGEQRTVAWNTRCIEQIHYVGGTARVA